MSPFTRVSWIPLAAFFVLSLLLEVRAGDDGCPFGGGGGAVAGAGAKIETQINTQTQTQTHTGNFSSLVTSATPVVTENTISSGNNAAVQADPMIEGLENVTAAAQGGQGGNKIYTEFETPSGVAQAPAGGVQCKPAVNGGPQGKLPDKEEKLPGETRISKDTDGDGEYDTTETTLSNGTTSTEKTTKTSDDKTATERVTKHPDGKTVTEIDTDDSSVTVTKWPDGKTETKTFANDENGKPIDKTETKWPDGKTQVKTGTAPGSDCEKTETKYPDGKTETHKKFADGEVKLETQYPDGKTETESYKNTKYGVVGGTIVTVYPDGKTETVKKFIATGTQTVTEYPDKTVVVEENDGRSKTTTTTKPDGTVTVRKEIKLIKWGTDITTQDVNGKTVEIRDKDGNVISTKYYNEPVKQDLKSPTGQKPAS